MPSLERWQMLEQQESLGSRWTWRRLMMDGSIGTISESFADYGACVFDAIKNGFRPTHDHWVVITPLGVTHYDAGAGTLSMPEKGAARFSRRRQIRKQKTAADLPPKPVFPARKTIKV